MQRRFSLKAMYFQGNLTGAFMILQREPWTWKCPMWTSTEKTLTRVALFPHCPVPALAAGIPSVSSVTGTCHMLMAGRSTNGRTGDRGMCFSSWATRELASHSYSSTYFHTHAWYWETDAPLRLQVYQKEGGDNEVKGGRVFRNKYKGHMGKIKGV